MIDSRSDVILCILDGWGCTTGEEDDAIHLAHTPFFDHLLRTYPNCKLATSGAAVGLPVGQAGNSEIGHSIIGSGRIIKADIVRINEVIESNELVAFVDCNTDEAMHILGLVSDGGVHSHLDHIICLAQAMGERGLQTYLHCFLDGRDVGPQTAMKYISSLQQSIERYSNVTIATIAGRFFAMDRDNNLDRTSLSYDAIVLGAASNIPQFIDAADYIERCYRQGIFDEHIMPAVRQDYKGMKKTDRFIMANYRADRVRQLLGMLVEHSRLGIGMVEYSAQCNEAMESIIKPLQINNTLGETVSNAGMRQLRISETEKYAHVTFFFNGWRDEPYANEDRKLLPSPKVRTYDLQPEMSSAEMTNGLIDAIGHYNLIVANYPGADMVGHSGALAPTIRAVEAIDGCLGRFIPVALAKNVVVIITADHGNAEKMWDNDQAFTAHTTNLTPFIVVGPQFIGKTLHEGSLCDIAPTILKVLNIAKPREMDGNDLFDW